MLVLLAGIMASLACAVGIAVVIDIARQRVWKQSEIEAFWGAPILIDIPEIVTDSDVAALQRKKLIAVASCAVVGSAYVACLYGAYLKHGFVLQLLDPVLQRLVYR